METNYQHWRKRLVELNEKAKKKRSDHIDYAIVGGTPMLCSDVSCQECDLSGHCDGASLIEWFESEYTDGINWKNIPEDTLVWVALDGELEVLRYYKGYDADLDSPFITYSMGATSKTASGTTTWDKCRLYKEE